MSIFDSSSVGCGVIARQVPKKEVKIRKMGCRSGFKNSWSHNASSDLRDLGLKSKPAQFCTTSREVVPKKWPEIGFFLPLFERKRHQILFCLFLLNPWSDFKISKLFLKPASHCSIWRPGFCLTDVRNPFSGPLLFRALAERRKPYCANLRAERKILWEVIRGPKALYKNANRFDRVPK